MPRTRQSVKPTLQRWAPFRTFLVPKVRGFIMIRALVPTGSNLFRCQVLRDKSHCRVEPDFSSDPRHF